MNNKNEYKFYFDNVKKIYEEQQKLSEDMGIMKITPATPNLLLDPFGKEFKMRQQMFYNRSGLKSGRYFIEKNEQYKKAYIERLKNFAEYDKSWDAIIDRIDKISTNQPIWNILPPLKDWYPQKKLFKGSSLPSIAQYKGETEMDMLQLYLYSDIIEALELIGV